MKYVILSELVGTPGDEYHPVEGVNLLALVEGGFIKAAPTSKKSDKTEATKES